MCLWVGGIPVCCVQGVVCSHKGPCALHHTFVFPSSHCSRLEHCCGNTASRKSESPLIQDMIGKWSHQPGRPARLHKALRLAVRPNCHHKIRQLHAMLASSTGSSVLPTGVQLLRFAELW